MGEKQKNHLKAYGIAYWVIEKDVSIEWLLNYRGGSFLMPHLVTIEEELMIRGVSYQILTEGQVTQIKSEIANPEVNMEVNQLEKPPKIAVYTPPNKQPNGKVKNNSRPCSAARIADYTACQITRFCAPG